MSRPLAVVTGASSGLGAEFARQLAARGYDLMLVARREDRLRELAGELAARYSIEAGVMAADLTREDDLSRVEEMLKSDARLALLVNNAGFGTKGRFFQVAIDGQDAMHRLHVMAPMRLSHAALSAMVPRQNGAVINVASVAAFLSTLGGVSYCSTKAWMVSFTQGLDLELRSIHSPVRVQALCPGFTITEFHDTMKVDRGVLPKWVWMRAESVVADSLRALDRGKVVVIPGWGYRVLVRVMRILPGGLRRYLGLRSARTMKRDVAPNGH